MRQDFLSKLVKADLDRSMEVPYLAGYSVDGKHVYIDKRLPRTLKLKDGREVQVDKYLKVHETTEKKLEDTKGYKYQYAHEKATGAERKAVEADGIPWDEYQAWMLSEVKKLEKLDSKVPKDIDLKPERDYDDKKMIGRVKKLEMRKAFLEKLIDLVKGGPGSGVKGHHTDRRPYPGQDQHTLDMKPVEDMRQRRRTYMPPEGTEHHYADSKNLRAYKNILRGFKQKGLDFAGHITYDPKNDQIIALSPKAKEVASNIVADLQAKQTQGN